MREKTVKLQAIEFEGIVATVRISGNTDDMAISLLHITEAVEVLGFLYHLRTLGDNKIMVYGDKDKAISIAAYLTRFGAVESMEDVMLYRIDSGLPDVNIDRYSEQVIIPEVVQ